MNIKIQIGKKNNRCHECGELLTNKTFAKVFPNGRAMHSRAVWHLCSQCFLNFEDRLKKSEGYEIAASALQEELL